MVINIDRENVKVKGHLVQELKTDRRTDGGDCITSCDNAVGNRNLSMSYIGLYNPPAYKIRTLAAH